MYWNNITIAGGGAITSPGPLAAVQGGRRDADEMPGYVLHIQYMGFLKMGAPRNGWFIINNEFIWMVWGVRYFEKLPCTYKHYKHTCVYQ